MKEIKLEKTIHAGGKVFFPGKAFVTDAEAVLIENELKRLGETDLAKPDEANASGGGLPEDFPMKHIFEAPNVLTTTGFKSVAEIQTFSKEDLVSIDGVGDKSADAALAYK